MSDAQVGTVLGGKFVVEGILGRGGMGVVYAARHRDLDQRVAIKCLLPHALAMPDVVERFAREARAAAKIHGEHVARVIDVGRFDDGTPFMVMEYLHGHDLSYELAAKGTIAPQDAVRYVLETCEALAQAHATRIVHRDLKPSNLFLAETPGRRPIVKVLDFGISKVVDAGGNALTNTSSVMGTPFYMSPEQLLSSKNVDERSDIWALGVILYELLAGTPPFGGDTAPEIIAKIVQNQPTAPTTMRSEIPPGLEAVIMRCLRTKTDERYANVAQLAAALQPFAAPGDRESVVAIAKVLGVSESPAAATLSSSERPAPSASAQTPPVGTASRASALGTAPNLTLSTPDVPVIPKRPAWIVPAVLGALLAVAVGAFVVVRGSSSHAPPATAAIVSPPVASVPPPASAALVALAALDPAPSSLASASVAVAAPPVPVPLAPPRPGTPAAGKPGAGPAAPQPPPASPPPAAPPAPPPAAPPPPPPAPTSHNPLDLQIK